MGEQQQQEGPTTATDTPYEYQRKEGTQIEIEALNQQLQEQELQIHSLKQQLQEKEAQLACMANWAMEALQRR